MTAASRPPIVPASGEEPPGLYLHIPFCRSKCAYCSFNSYPCRQPPGHYLTALEKQLDFWSAHPWCRERTFATLFLGGGTPTIYGGRVLASLVGKCLSAFNFCEKPEITVEANPNAVTEQDLGELRQGGVNRLSLGVQAFSDPLLAAIGRTHTVAEAGAAIRAARRAGFANLNLDLIYGLPGQTLCDWQRTLDAALGFSPEHLACYELTIEEGTAFARELAAEALALPGEEEVVAMAAATGEAAARAGLARYEISNYARPGFACRHNCNYWQNGSYLGLGAGAASCLSGLRLKNLAAPARYSSLALAGVPPFAEAECLPLAARFRESVIMGLRLTAGLSFSCLRKRFGLTPPGYYGKILLELRAQGLIAVGRDSMRLTDKGLCLANQVLARLV